eukprot:jgi/Mesen1/10570/ME000085S09901
MEDERRALPGWGTSLVLDLNNIFEDDPYIDEVGIVPSTCPGNMGTDADVAQHPESSSPPHDGIPDSSGLGREGIDHGQQPQKRLNPAQFDTSAFWCKEHKLAIAAPAAKEMYAAASAAFHAAQKSRAAGAAAQGSQADLHSVRAEEEGATVAGADARGARTMRSASHGDATAGKDADVAGCTRALVLINADHLSAWNMRKALLLAAAGGGADEKGKEKEEENEEEQQQLRLRAELRLAGAVLTLRPKSAETWAHRRWVLSQLAQRQAAAAGWAAPAMQSLLQRESALVLLMAERSAMNYRAWSHRGWLVPRLSLAQVKQELGTTRPWAQRHVEDNCVFHYRQRLLLRLLEEAQQSSAGDSPDHNLWAASEEDRDGDGTSSPQSKFSSLLSSTPSEATAAAAGRAERRGAVRNSFLSEVQDLLKAESEWNRDLLQLCGDREALWLHRRFLAHLWCCQVSGSGGPSPVRSWTDSSPSRAESVVAPATPGEELLGRHLAGADVMAAPASDDERPTVPHLVAADVSNPSNAAHTSREEEAQGRLARVAISPVPSPAPCADAAPDHAQSQRHVAHSARAGRCVREEQAPGGNSNSWVDVGDEVELCQSFQLPREGVEGAGQLSHSEGPVRQQQARLATAYLFWLLHWIQVCGVSPGLHLDVEREKNDCSRKLEVIDEGRGDMWQNLSETMGSSTSEEE